MDDQNTRHLRSQLKAYLIRKGINPGKPFRCLNPGHEDSNPSMSFYAKNNTVKCFSCGQTYSLFDLIGIDQGLASFSDQKKAAAELFPIGLISEPARPKTRGGGADHQPKDNPNPMFAMGTLQTFKQKYEALKGGSEVNENQPMDQSQNYEAWHAQVKETDYWNFRAINQETIDRFRLGYDPARQAVVIPCTSTYYVARAVHDGPGPRYLNMKGVPVQLFNETALDQLERPVWITEGAIDALTLLQSGSIALAMNSATMGDKLLTAISKRTQLPDLILCLDKDKAGETFTEKLAGEFRARNLRFTAVKIPDPYQDTNSHRKQQEGAHLAFVRETEGLVKTLISQERENQLEELVKTSFDSHLESFVKRKAKNVFIPTGFSQLDRHLGGGLYEGLIILGAQSSLGKTTLALQIANQAARSGELVIFFSLEQSITELIQKSISMVSGQLLTQWDVKQLSADQIPLGDSRLDIYSQACDHLFSYGKGLHVIETARTISEISSETFRIMNLAGKNPLVIIDYLQVILPDPGDQLNEKRHNIDFNVSELKRLSATMHVPIMVISSLNRFCYNQDISQAAFKESGGIEYSSDLLLGLQFQALDPDSRAKGTFDPDKEMAEPTRKVQVKIIKQRDGLAGKRVNLKYHAAYNLFEELTHPGSGQ